MNNANTNRFKPAPAETFTVGEELSLPPRFDEIARCSVCRYSEPLHRTEDQYTCRINPPVIDPQGPRANGGADWRGVWPIVFEHELCGRFWPREPLHLDDAMVQAYRAYRVHEAELRAMRSANAARREHAETTATGRRVITVKKIEKGAAL